MWIQSWLLWHVHDHVVGIIWTIEKIVICTIHFWPNIIKFINGGCNNEGICNPKEKPVPRGQKQPALAPAPQPCKGPYSNLQTSNNNGLSSFIFAF